MNPEQALERLEEALRRIIAATENVIAKGEAFSPEEERELSDVILLAGQRIVALRQEISTQEASIQLPTQSSQIPTSEHESSNVNGFRYDPDTGKLLVQFHGPYPKAEGPIYEYGDVPKYLVDVLARGAIGPKTSGQNAYHRWIRGVTPSLGGTLNALIKAGGFPYQKVA